MRRAYSGVSVSLPVWFSLRFPSQGCIRVQVLSTNAEPHDNRYPLGGVVWFRQCTWFSQKGAVALAVALLFIYLFKLWANVYLILLTFLLSSQSFCSYFASFLLHRWPQDYLMFSLFHPQSITVLTWHVFVGRVGSFTIPLLDELPMSTGVPSKQLPLMLSFAEIHMESALFFSFPPSFQESTDLRIPYLISPLIS